MFSIFLRRVCMCVVSAVAISLGTATVVGAGTLPITVMTYNTDNGGQPDGQLDTIAAANPDVVVLQEAAYTQLAYYVDGLNSRLGTTAWHGKYARHCKYGTQPTCTTWYNGSVMILTRLSTLATDSTLIWAADDYQVARATMHMRVALKDGTPVNVFVCHLPATIGGSFSGAEAAREKYATVFKQWAQSFSGPQLVGGDFNTHPGSTTFQSMSAQFADAWTTYSGSSSGGYTHTNPNVSTRLDYWWGNLSGSQRVSTVSVVADSTHSDHRPVRSTFTVPATTTTSTLTTLMSDGFASLDRSTWPGGVITGGADSTIPIGVANSVLTIGPLKASTTGSHYNAISTDAYDLTHDGWAIAQLVHATNTATSAYAMLTLGSDANNFYRWYQSGTALIAQKRIAGVKTTVADIPYDPTADQFLRIRRQYNSSTGYEEVIFETAPANSGVPGTFTVRHTETWTSQVVASALRLELKAGTSTAVVSPGTATWDNITIAAY